jgi:hypothetical protein
MVSDASFMPTSSTSAPSRRNFKHHHVERGDARGVPDMRAADIDDDGIQRFA